MGKSGMYGVILGDNMEVLCKKCGAIMKKLYWPNRHLPDGYMFSEWFGCTDCGDRIYDKERDKYLQ